MLRRRVAPLLLVLLGCGGQPDTRCRSVPTPDCPTSGGSSTAPILGVWGLPDWTLAPGLPLGTRADLTGLWTPLPSRWMPLPARRVNASGTDPIAPGPVERRVGCQSHYGIEAVMLRQQERRVVARWIVQAGASGAERREERASYEIDEGNVADGVLRMNGVRIDRTTYVDDPRVDATYRAITYELRFEEATGHLVGTRNGEPFRLVPLSLSQAGAGECPGPPA